MTTPASGRARPVLADGAGRAIGSADHEHVAARYALPVVAGFCADLWEQRAATR